MTLEEKSMFQTRSTPNMRKHMVQTTQQWTSQFTSEPSSNPSLQMQMQLQKSLLLGFKKEFSATPSLQSQISRSPSQNPTTLKAVRCFNYSPLTCALSNLCRQLLAQSLLLQGAGQSSPSTTPRRHLLHVEPESM